MGYLVHECCQDGVIDPRQNRPLAVQSLRKAYELAPRQAEVCTWLASALSGIPGNETEAIEFLNRAVALEPRNGNRYIMRADMRRRMGETAGAGADIAMAMKLSVSPALLHMYHARYAFQEGRREEAFKLIGEIIDKTRAWPAHTFMWITLGMALGQEEKVAAARERLRREHPDYYATYLVSAIAREKAGDLPGALEEARAGQKIAPYNAELNLHEAFWLAKSGQAEPALKKLDFYLTLYDSKRFETCELRFKLLCELKNLGAAEECLARMLKQFPDRRLELAKYAAILQRLKGQRK